MLKIRITYADKKELEIALEKIKKEFNVLNISKEYRGRGTSAYSNIYVDVENR